MSESVARLAAFDAVMYGVEQDPVLRSTIVVMVLLDREPDIAVGIARVERMTRLVPKLRQVVSGTPNSLLPPRWEPDPHFDLDYHLRHYRVADEDGTLRPALRIAEQMAEQDFDRNRPLWEMALIAGLPEGRAAVVMKIHHSITDGVGGMLMAASLFDLSEVPTMPDGDAPEVAPARDRGTAGLLVDGVGYSVEQGAKSTVHYAGLLRDAVRKVIHDPTGTAVESVVYGASAARVLAPAGEAMSPLMTGRTLAIRVDVLEAPLDQLKAAGKDSGGTLNDAFIAVVSGGLQRYHEALGSPIGDVRINMPVNLRTDGDSGEGNRWVPARFLIPIDVTDPRERIRDLSPLLRAARSEPALPISDFVMRRLVQLPRSLMTAVAGGLMKGTDVAATNVPGPPIPVYLAGAEVLAIVPFAPKGGAALNVALMSYRGKVFLGLNIDTGAVRQPDLMVECMAAALDEVLAIGREALADPAVSARPWGKSATKPAAKSSAKSSSKKPDKSTKSAKPPKRKKKSAHP